MSRWGLRGRVTVATALALAAGLALLSLGVSILLSHQLNRDLSATLQERADVQLAAISRQHGRLIVRDTPNDQILDEQAWVFENGRVVRRANAPAEVQQAAKLLSRARGPTGRTIDDDVGLRAEPILVDHGKHQVGTVIVGASLLPYEHTKHIALIATILLDLFVLAAGALLARRAVGTALQPVIEMTQRASEWSEHNLDRRFDLGPPRDELTQLSATLDRLLARIASSLRHEQRLSAEMAHELRTPLSGVRGEAELALRDPDVPSEVRESLLQILRGTDRMASVIDTLLTAARLAAEPARGSSDPEVAASLAIEALGPLGERTDVAVSLRPVDVVGRVGAEAELISQALHPLLENAVRHARSAVSVVILREHSEVLFGVEDDGAGLSCPDTEQLFEPGKSTTGGAGLGLSLARRLARSCGGDVNADSSAPGGRFVLRLPAVS
jgi:two-component system OmpR family sensor kinase